MRKKLHALIGEYVKILQRFADRRWFPFVLGFLAAIDNFIIVVPNEGILISSSMVIPKRWFIFALCVAIGSTIGALGLVALIELKGLPWIIEFYPGINETQVWSLTSQFFEKYGLYLIFAIGITPFAQQPSIILASLADTPLSKLAAVILLGRSIKFFSLAYAGTHAPKLLTRIWGVREELEEVGVKIDKD